MTLTQVGSLPEASTIAGNDTVVIVVGGKFYRTTVDFLKQGMAVATESAKGLMSSTDKSLLNTINSQLSALVAPTSAPVATAATIAVPSGKYHITLSGVTNVTDVTGLIPRVIYTFSYPAGAGITFLGEQMKAGDVITLIDD